METGLLQNLIRHATAPSNFDFVTRQKDVSRLKGAICGLQAGDMQAEASRRLEDGTCGRDVLLAGVPCPQHKQNSANAAFQANPVLQTDQPGIATIAF